MLRSSDQRWISLLRIGLPLSLNLSCKSHEKLHGLLDGIKTKRHIRSQPQLLAALQLNPRFASDWLHHQVQLEDRLHESGLRGIRHIQLPRNRLLERDKLTSYQIALNYLNAMLGQSCLPCQRRGFV
ncbi:hypothetical protein D3C78_1306800 [compost metagenome]